MNEAKRSENWFSAIARMFGYFGDREVRQVFLDACQQSWVGEHPVFVHGLPLPKLLVDMLANGSWQHPGDEIIAKEFPFFRGEEIDLLAKREIEHEPEPWNAQYRGASETWHYFLHEIRGSRVSKRMNRLPWLDVEKAVFIAACRIPGTDIGIALDYRTYPSEPRVVATEWLEDGGCIYRKVANSFEEFVRNLGMLKTT